MLAKTSRRTFLSSTAAAAVGTGMVGMGVAAAPTQDAAEQDAANTQSKSPNERPVFGFVGAGIRFHNIIGGACSFGPAAALADVDAVQRGRGIQSIRNRHRERDYPINVRDYEDYRYLLDRDDIDAVVIATPDHWHTKIAVEAMQAGKDVYCEKPLTLTIQEGQLIREALAKYPSVFQVGTQQRTWGQFAKAVAMARAGRAGRISRVTCAIGGSNTCDPLPVATPPKHLNWDMWLGQAPMVDYRESEAIVDQKGYGAGHPLSRTHNYFRWWYEYSGGKLTDWGAHHVDIALWAVEKSTADIGPVKIEPIHVTHPVPFDDKGMPTQADRFNAATKFLVRVTFADGLEMDVCNTADELGFGNGVMFQGDRGRFFVNRGKLTGKPVEELASNPLPEDALEKLFGRKAPASHMGDFVNCIKTRETPISDAESHHRNLSICHAINIAMRLGRSITFDPATEDFVGDPVASGFVAREQRKGYEIRV